MRFLLAFILLFSCLQADIKEMQLSNGMRVILKQVPDHDEDLEVRLIAPGGWTGFSKHEKTNARIITEVLWESGFGNLTPDQLHALMWLHSVELSSDIGPFCRTIEGTASPEGIETLFKLIHALFTEPALTEEGLSEAKRKIAENVRMQPYDTNYTFDYFSKAINTAHYKGFRQLSIGSLKRKTSLEMVKSVYDRCFGTPSGFTVFIAGQFDEDEVKILLDKYLGTIPPRERLPIQMTTLENGKPAFPKTTARLEIPTLQIGSNESLIRMTFPIQRDLDTKNFRKIFLLTKLIDKRLSKKFETSGVVGEGYCFCNFSFPFYPYLTETWITIQSRSSGSLKEPQQIEIAILSALEELKEKGPTETEIIYLNALTQDKEVSHEFVKLFLIGESMDEIVSLFKEPVTKEEIAEIIAELVDLSRYTAIFSKK